MEALLQTPPGGHAWQPYKLPGKRYAAFELTQHAGVPALTVQSEEAVSILRRRYENDLPQVDQLSFSWQVEGLPEGARLGEAGRDDAPVRILLAFDGDRSRWTGRNHRMSEMSRMLTGEDLPYATLMYVWANQEAPESIIVNPRTDRIRKLVVESGPRRLGQWLGYRRNVREDFVKVFGEAPGPLRSVAIMTDTDNTRSRLRAWYGEMVLTAR